KLLVVEDDVVQQRSIADLLRGEDVEVVAVTSGKEALEQLEGGGFDSLVLDLLLPDEDGSRLLEDIKTNPKFQDIPVVVYNGKDAISALERNPDVDVVLMDVMMPEMDGYQTMRAIRSDPAHKALPIIAITAKALKEDREKCIQAGASDYLPKPVENDKLLEL